MKPTPTALILMTGLLALIHSPLRAQEATPAPPAESAPKPADAPPPSSRRPQAPEGEPMRGSRSMDEKPTSFIGVLTGNVPRELRTHFGLADGFGLLVQEVMPDSPAQAAGIKVDDILIRFEDQKLVNMEQLQTLVRSKKKDESVSLTLISQGVEKQLTVKIGERLMPAQQDEPRRGGGFFQPFDGSFGGRRGGPDMMGEMRESLERYQKQLNEYQERMREWNRQGSQGILPQGPAWTGPGHRDSGRRDEPKSREGDRGSSRGPRDGEHHVERREYRETANVTRSDDSGIYSLRREGERTLFTAKPKDGAEQSWNLNNEEERRAIPEPMREKLRLLEEIRGADKASSDSPRRPDSRDGQGRPPSDPPKREGGI